MDESVLRAMARWPDVPAVFGWLSLDRRGRWCLRGEPIENARARAYIARNYAVDEHGRWFFQNGPQRVFVALEYTPHVVFADATGAAFATHAGWAVRSLDAAFVDSGGALVLATEHGAAVLADRDLGLLAERLQGAGGAPCDEGDIEALLGGEDVEVRLAWGETALRLARLEPREAPGRFGYDPDPRSRPGE